MDIPSKSDQETDPGQREQDKTCIQVNEPEQNNWHDNWLCMPNNSPYGFEWSAIGEIDGKECIQIYDGEQEKNTDAWAYWKDNYICAYKGNRR